MIAAHDNLSRRPTCRLLALMAGVSAWALSAGCAKQPPIVTSATIVAESPPPLTPVSLAPGQGAPLVPAASDKPSSTTVTPTASDGADRSTPSGYQPPFPDRVELFVAPKREGGLANAEPQQNSVELIGFVRVDRQHAVLSIDGNVAPIAAGETQFGVKVISINAPKVVLERGRQRWQATLE